jgi:hypothetical protein
MTRRKRTGNINEIINKGRIMFHRIVDGLLDFLFLMVLLVLTVLVTLALGV